MTVSYKIHSVSYVVIANINTCGYRSNFFQHHEWVNLSAPRAHWTLQLQTTMRPFGRCAMRHGFTYMHAWRKVFCGFDLVKNYGPISPLGIGVFLRHGKG